MERKKTNPPEATAATVFVDPRENDVKTTALSFPARAGILEVVNQASLTIAEAFVKDARAMMEKIRETFNPQIDKANKLHKSLIAERDKFLDPLERAEKIVRPKIAQYLYEEDQKRLAAARAAQMAEEKARAIADKAVDKAHDLILKGEGAKADAAIEKGYAKTNAILSAVPPVPDAPVAESSVRTLWDFEIVNPALIPQEYTLPDKVKIGMIVRAEKNKELTEKRIPGIRVFTKQTIFLKSE